MTITQLYDRMASFLEKDVGTFKLACGCHLLYADDDETSISDIGIKKLTTIQYAMTPSFSCVNCNELTPANMCTPVTDVSGKTYCTQCWDAWTQRVSILQRVNPC